MNRRTFLSCALPVAGAVPVVASTPNPFSNRALIGNDAIPVKGIRERLMEAFPGGMGGISAWPNCPPVLIEVPTGKWKILWTGYKGGMEYTARVAQWIAGRVDRELGDPIVCVSNPGYGQLLHRGMAINISARLGIPYFEGIESAEEATRMQGFCLDVILDMITCHSWDHKEDHVGNSGANIDVAWPRLKPKTKFYLDTHRWYREITGEVPLDPYNFYAEEIAFVLTKSREYGFTV